MKKNQGFTAVELLIVLVIIGILSAIAIPSYRSYVWRSNRSEAITNLTQMAMLVEQHRALYGSYCLTACAGTATATYTYQESDNGTVKGANTMGPGKTYLSGFRPKQATTGTAVRYNYQAVVANDTYDLSAAAVTSRNVPNTTLGLDEVGEKKETLASGTVEYGW